MTELEYQEHIQHTHNAFCMIVIRYAAIDMALHCFFVQVSFPDTPILFHFIRKPFEKRKDITGHPCAYIWSSISRGSFDGKI